MDRMSTVAGQFYPGDPFRIKDLARKLISRPAGEDLPSPPVMLAMVPHAGYIFSGPTAGRTLSRTALDGTIIMLGPNHTGMGAKMAVWPDGTWRFPGAGLPVNSDLASALTSAEARLVADRSAHMREHSLEVILPLLYYLNPTLRIVPICVSEPNLEILSAVAASMAEVIKAWPEKTCLLVSSDMSHYISASQAKTQDNKALERILALDPDGLYSTARANNITMCGVLPMTLGLFIVKALGASKAELIYYSHSGQVTGDTEQVVGYAGVLVW